MKNSQVIELYNGLSKISNLKGVKLNYAIAKNVSLLKSEVDSLEKSVAPSDEFQEYDKKRVELVKKFSKLDDKGNAIILNNEYLIEDQKSLEEAFDIFKKENKEVLDKRQEQLDNFKDLLQEENSLKLFKILIDLVPEEITTEQMKFIYPLIQE